MKRKQKAPKSIQTILKRVQKGCSLSKLFSKQPTKFYPMVVLADDEEIIVSISDFSLTIQCAPENRTKKNLFKNLIKSPV
ncbi:hypothetical protein RYH73_16415 [Olivibacter sp. CPCC 100613]|uniref:hypothetical protein n=1 Tax=Olivibacter sp. CPCC 100613 TaxID=3079931 RepID=UPI002FF84EB2